MPEKGEGIAFIRAAEGGQLRDVTDILCTREKKIGTLILRWCSKLMGQVVQMNSYCLKTMWGYQHWQLLLRTGMVILFMRYCSLDLNICEEFFLFRVDLLLTDIYKPKISTMVKYPYQCINCRMFQWISLNCHGNYRKWRKCQR